MKEYRPGDQIKFRLTFDHKTNLAKIWATFTYQGEEDTNVSFFVIPGRVTSQEQREGYKRSVIQFGRKHELVAIVPGGEYALTDVTAESLGGIRMPLTGLAPANIRCRLLSDDPEDRPSFVVLIGYRIQMLREVLSVKRILTLKIRGGTDRPLWGGRFGL